MQNSSNVLLVAFLLNLVENEWKFVGTVVVAVFPLRVFSCGFAAAVLLYGFAVAVFSVLPLRFIHCCFSVAVLSVFPLPFFL